MTLPDASSSQSLETAFASDRRPGIKSWLVAGGLGMLLAGGGFLAWRLLGSRGGPGMQMPPGVTVQLAPVQSGSVRDSSEFLGTLEAQTGVVLQPEVSGRVTQIFVAAGDRVSTGQPIALISPDRTQAEFNAAAANVSAAQAARESAAASLQSLLARRAELEAELSLEQAEFERTESLVSQGAQSQQELDLARRDLDVAQATLNSALNEIQAAQSQLTQSEATLAQARANQAAALLQGQGWQCGKSTERNWLS